jgi:hypothetical protein
MTVWAVMPLYLKFCVRRSVSTKKACNVQVEVVPVDGLGGLEVEGTAEAELPGAEGELAGAEVVSKKTSPARIRMSCSV